MLKLGAVLLRSHLGILSMLLDYISNLVALTAYIT